MLKNLCYTNEIVVDITNNCIQSLFWLGAAHGSEVDAITVKQELSEKERIILEGNAVDKNRNIFDVSGLWTAYYYSHNTEGFYHQLALAQFGIEKHSKIIPSDVKWYGFKRWEYLEIDDVGDNEGYSNFFNVDQLNDKTTELAQRKRKLALESYYRRKFWDAMLRYNRLRIYIPQHDDMDNDDYEPRLRAAKWDIDAVSGLTHYLSKRSVIGDYLVVTLPKDMADDRAEKVNFICIGQPISPLQKDLSEYIWQKCQDAPNDGYKNLHHFNVVHKYGRKDKHIKVYNDNTQTEEEILVQMKGFVCKDLNRPDKKGFYKAHPWAVCEECSQNGVNTASDVLNDFPMRSEKQHCPFKIRSSHTEIAQLILWREDDKETGNQYYRVSLIGSSGPATFGLSSLFVDEGQKLHDFVYDNSDIANQDNTLLYTLQERVRTKIIALISQKLWHNILENITQDIPKEKREHYAKMVLYIVCSYLRTVLYRYFLPFLTEKDIHRICNETIMFVNTMKAAKQSPFYLDDQFESNEDNGISRQKLYGFNADDISETLKEVLVNFKGLETFYEVEVTHRSIGSNIQNTAECSAGEKDVPETQTIGGQITSGKSNLVAAEHDDSQNNTVRTGDENLPQNKPYCARVISRSNKQKDKEKEKENKRQKDNRRVISIEMMDEINYFVMDE